MELMKYTEQLRGAMRKYRTVLIVVLAGLFLMLLPEGKEPASGPAPEAAGQGEESLQDRLSAVLSQMEGAGKTQVLLTEAEGEQIRYQCNEERREGELRRTTVLLNGSGREEQGLVAQITPPKLRGAVILCQGADRGAVRLAVVDAVIKATGLRSNQISVLKMQ